MPPTTPKWKVRLAGEERDLKVLSRHFTAPEARVFGEEGNFFVSSSAFEALSDGHALVKRAEELIARMNRAMRFRMGRPPGRVSVDPVTYESIDEEDAIVTHYLEAEVTLKLRSTWNISRPPQAIRPSPPDSVPETLVKLGATNQYVGRILDSYSSRGLRGPLQGSGVGREGRRTGCRRGACEQDGLVYRKATATIHGYSKRSSRGWGPGSTCGASDGVSMVRKADDHC